MRPGVTPTWIAVLAAAALVALAIVVAAQPLTTDDLWWHLALGRAYAAGGPWLAEDPLLFTAPAAPTPASWLWDLALHGVERSAGFQGLRALHAALVLATAAAAFALLRRTSRSTLAAALGTAVWLGLSTYRLGQLRPHLLTFLAAIALYALLLAPGRVPPWSRVWLSALGMALWANLHPGFPVGLLMLAGAVAGLLAATPLRIAGHRALDRRRAGRLAVALLLGLVASLASPAGLDSALAFFVAGSETPDLGRVADEWLPVSLLRAPVPTLPPSRLAWLSLWGLGIATPLSAAWAARRWRGTDGARRPDPVMVALALGALAAPLVAVRFLWLGLFPLLLVATAVGVWLAERDTPARRRAAWAAAAVAVALLPGFLRHGDWPMLTRALPRTAAGWKVPYRPAKFYGHSTWLLADAGITGNAYNDYATGGFLGYWLAPGLKTFLNGTLNVPPEIAGANLPIRERRGARAGESFLELLDRLGVDVFVGIHLPQLPMGRRPWYRTTAHLEGEPGWVLAFRNLRSAVYLRRGPGSRENLERLSAYYAEHDVPFDPEAGFDPARVLREAGGWAVRHGLATRRHPQLGAFAMRLNAGGDQALNTLAVTFASLGLHERAGAAARRRLARGESPVARRVLVWSLLQQGDAEAARRASGPLAEAARGEPLTRALTDAAERLPGLEAEAAAALLARLPLLGPAEAQALLARTAHAQPRPPRPPAPGA